LEEQIIHLESENEDLKHQISNNEEMKNLQLILKNLTDEKNSLLRRLEAIKVENQTLKKIKKLDVTKINYMDTY